MRPFMTQRQNDKYNLSMQMSYIALWNRTDKEINMLCRSEINIYPVSPVPDQAATLPEKGQRCFSKLNTEFTMC